MAAHYNIKTSKHYYMGAQRVATNLGTYTPPISGPGGPIPDFKKESSTHPLISNLTDILTAFRLEETHEYTAEALLTRADFATYHGTVDSAQAYKTEGTNNTAPAMRLMYWYHPDLLASRATLARSAARHANVMREPGHVEYITDRDGLPLALSGAEVYQYFWYSPWGETLHEQKASSPNGWGTPYKFNDYGGKSFWEAFDEHSARSAELDDEPTERSSRAPLKIKENSEHTGLYYYGARYYTCPDRHCRFGMDPMAEKYPNMTSYVFTGNNPVMLVDPDGMRIILSGLSDVQEKLFYKNVNALNHSSRVFKHMYKDVLDSEESFFVKSPQATPKNLVLLSKAAGYFREGDNGKHTIALDKYNNNSGYTPSTISEEFFHAGQYLFNKDKGISQYSLSSETEARVFRAFIAYEIINEGGNVEGYGLEGYVNDFLQNEAVNDYFGVVHSGQKPTEMQTKNYRSAVRDLAKEVNKRYGQLDGWNPGEQADTFNGATPYLDELFNR